VEHGSQRAHAAQGRHAPALHPWSRSGRTRRRHAVPSPAPIAARDSTWQRERWLDEEVIVGALAEVRRRLTHRMGQPSALPDLERRARQLQGSFPTREAELT